MGISTSAQLIAKGKAENSYNNSGISTDATWLDFFNDALRDLVDDLNIEKPLPPIVYDGVTREYDLPTDYYSVVRVLDANGYPVQVRRNYEQTLFGYYIMNRGSKYVIDFYKGGFSQSFRGLYIAYPSVIADSEESPDVPTNGEKALIYYALAKSLRNSNQVGMAKEMEEKYEVERKKIRNASSRARGL